MTLPVIWRNEKYKQGTRLLFQMHFHRLHGLFPERIFQSVNHDNGCSNPSHGHAQKRVSTDI